MMGTDADETNRADTPAVPSAPTPGAGLSWPSRPVVGFDTETTGVDIASDRVVTAALVRRAIHGSGGPAAEQTRAWLLNPGVEIPPAATAVHGITTERARTHGQNAETGLGEIAEMLGAAVERGECLVAFNATYDLGILDRELTRHGLASLAARVGPATPLTVADPLVLDRALDRYRPGKRTLGRLCEVYDVSAEETLHDAGADTRATLAVLAAMLERYPQLAAMDPAALMAFQREHHAQWAKNFNSWRASRGYAGPAASTSWL